MLNFTKHNLKKIETLFEELTYTVRYEKGNFQSGYCIVENKNIVVINKFYDTEGRINCLIDILSGMDLSDQPLSEPSQKLVKIISKMAENLDQAIADKKEVS